MSILDGLPSHFLGDDGRLHEVDPARAILVGPWLRGSDVREALTNPTDEQVKHLTDHAITAFAQGIRWGDGSADDLLSGVVRAVLAAAGGVE